MASHEELSKHLSLYLDELGFSEERIRERIHTMTKCSRAKDSSTKRITGRNDIEKIFVGSKREGLGFEYVNDTDVLQIDHGIVCQSNSRNSAKTGRTVFKIEQDNAPPGHCWLRLIGQNVQSESYKRIEYALDKRKTGQYISSDIFMTRNDDIFNSGNGFISKNTHYLSRQGPSIPKYVDGELLGNCMLSMTRLNRTYMDFVRAFPCRAKGILKEWSERKRLNNWPTPDNISHVIKLLLYIVPVGQKNSSNEDLQWRICFNLAEIHLVKSFSIVQKKVLVLLKIIAKHLLQPVSKCITSFAMKNVTFWLAEQIPQEQYCEEHLIDRLKDALVYLAGCVQKGELPCYMIPKRNLFAGKLQNGEQRLIQEKLNQILLSGITELNSYFTFYESSAMHVQIDKIANNLFIANNLDKLQTCRIAMLSTEQFTEYNVTMFLYKSKWKIMFYHIIFHMIPFLYTYGKQGLFEPLNVKLSNEHMTEDLSQKQRNITNQIPTESCKPQCRYKYAHVQPPVILLFLTLFGDVVSFFNIPRLCLI